MTEDHDRRLSLGDKILLALDERYPSLSSLVRVLWFQPWFRAIFLILIIGVIAGALFVTKIWKTTPPGFHPEIRISGVDLFQARALKRSALKQAAEGRFDDAVQSWFMAIANNAGDPDLVRGALNYLVGGPSASKYSDASRSYAGWLLRLEGTNTADLELVTSLFEKQNFDQATVVLLKHCNRKLTPKLEGSYLKALFNTRDFEGFDLSWRNMEYKREAADNLELQLYHAAFVAGWGDQKEGYKASETLLEAQRRPETEELAHRLQLRVSYQRMDDRAYRSSLEYLEQHLRATLKENIGYWELLVNLGRKPEAARLIQATVLKPASGEEVVQLAKIYFDVGLDAEAGGILKTYSTVFPTSEALWASYANLLIEQKRWDELRGYALEMRRRDNPIHNSLAGYGCYLEGRAELGLNRRETAEAAFQKLSQYQFENRMLATLVAINLAQLGYPDPANKLLSKLELELANDPHYWLLLSKNAYDLRDANLLRYALGKSYELRPQDPGVINNYAAILLCFREKPDEAIQLTLRMLSLFPKSASVRINHACALLQNKRTAEAHRMLDSIDPKNLKTSDASSYYMALFETALEEHDTSTARKVSEQVDRSTLLGPDKVWFDRAMTNLAAAKSI